MQQFFLVFQRQVFKNFSRQFARQESEQDSLVVRLEIHKDLCDVRRGELAKDFLQPGKVPLTDEFRQFGHEKVSNHRGSETEKKLRRKTKKPTGTRSDHAFISEKIRR